MKKYFWLIAFFITFIACSKPGNDPVVPTPDPPTTPSNPGNPVNEVSGRIAIFSKSQKFVLYLSGKNVTVDWGSPAKYTYAKLDSTVAITQNYISAIHDTVIITGTNITYLKCSGNNLLNLDVTGNPALTYLDCSANNLDSLNVQPNAALRFVNVRGNNLSQSKLDKLFTSLHNNTKPKDSVLFINNPGSFNTTGSIATAKGWSIDKQAINKPVGITFTANLTKTTLGVTGTNIVIDWGDGSYETYPSLTHTSFIVHNYSQAIRHWVKVGGDVITHLNSAYTGIADLNVSAATGLTYLNCSNSDQYTLDVTKNTALQYLDCHDTRASGLDVSKNTALTYLDCSSGGGYQVNFINRLDVTNSPNLKYLNCTRSEVVNLDISKNAALTELYCSDNVRLAALNLSGNPALERLDCHNTILTSLDVSASAKLKWLDCNYSKIATLNVSNNPALTYLNCYRNNLTALNVSSCTALQELSCADNSIAVLDVSKNTALTSLYCAVNKLTALDVSNNPFITQVRVSQNELSTTALNNLFTSLRTLTPTTTGVIYQSLNPGSGTCNRSIATNKWWVIYDY